MKQREKTVSILDRLSWTVQPPKGLIKGNYFREEARFSSCFPADPGHLGVLANGISSIENQMVRQNRLTGDFDLVAGASNSIRRSMLPLAERIAARINSPSRQLYYGLAKELEPGVTGRLQLVIEDKKIIRFFYDEIFADTPEEIKDPELAPYYRQSKYYCPDYVSTSGAGFNTLSDLLAQSVLCSQDLLGLVGLPYAKGENRASDWDRYLQLARPLQEEMRADGVY